MLCAERNFKNFSAKAAFKMLVKLSTESTRDLFDEISPKDLHETLYNYEVQSDKQPFDCESSLLTTRPDCCPLLKIT